MRKLIVAIALAAIAATPASAARYCQPQRALLTGPCEGEYVLVASLLGVETELARVSCASLPICVSVEGLWPDESISGRFSVRDEQGTLVTYDLPAARDNTASCPAEAAQ